MGVSNNAVLKSNRSAGACPSGSPLLMVSISFTLMPRRMEGGAASSIASILAVNSAAKANPMARPAICRTTFVNSFPQLGHSVDMLLSAM